MFEYLVYDGLISRYSTRPEEELAKKEVQIEVAGRKLLKMDGKNGVLIFSGRRECEDLTFLSYFGSMMNLGSRSVQQQAVRTTTTVHREEEDAKHDEEENPLCFYRKRLSVGLCNFFLSYTQLTCNENIAQGIINQLAVPYDWVATMLKRLE